MLDIQKILETLDYFEVEYVVIGGVAALLNNAPYFTEDIDLTPLDTEANLKKLIEALKKMNAKLFTVDDPEGLPINLNTLMFKNSNILSFLTNHGVIDIIIKPLGTNGFKELNKESNNHILSLPAIIRLKETANRPKDQGALYMLRKLMNKNS